VGGFMVKQATVKKTRKPAVTGHRKAYTKLDREAEKVEEDLVEMEEESVQDVIHAAEALDLDASAAMDIGTKTLQAWNEFGSVATGTLREISSGVMENWMQLCTGYTEACQKALTGRASGDKSGSRANPLQQMMGGYLEESAKLYAMWLDSMKGLKP
jgi:hypothetical protein